jgi:hypothetical protein
LWYKEPLLDISWENSLELIELSRLWYSNGWFQL